MRKIFVKILNIFIVLLPVAAVAVYFTGGWKFSLLSVRFNINSVPRIINIFLILFIVKALFNGKSSPLEGILKNVSSFFDRSDNEKSFPFLFVLFTFALWGVILGICDGLFEPLKLIQTLSTPLPATGMERISRIGTLIISYGFGSLLSAITLAFFISILKNKLKQSLPANPISFAFYVSGAIAISILLSSKSALNLLSPEHFGPLTLFDCISYVIFSFILFYFIPKAILRKKPSKAVIPLLVAVVLSGLYIFPEYLSNDKYAEEMEKPHRRVILITIDTTRADHLGIYGYQKDTTPLLQKQADKGVVFLRAYSQMTTTDPSHTTILSGVYPRTHGLLKNGMPLSNGDIDFLQSWFKKQGYTTGAITSRAFLDPDFMGLPAFDYKSVPNSKFKTKRGKKFKYDIATGTYKRAKFWIDRNLDKDIFLWVHFWDPHGSYVPPAPYNSKFNEGYKGRYRYYKEIFPGFAKFREERYTQSEIEYITSLYDGEIGFTDVYVSKLIDYIDDKIPANLERPFFIVTSDHGETLGEIQEQRGYAFDHGKILTYSQMHVPLFFLWEGVIPAGRQIDNIVGLVDIAPTIAELVNEKNQFSSDGVSLKNILTGSDDSEFSRNYIVSQRRLIDKETPSKYKFLNAREYAVIKDKWCLRINDVRGNELYDISKDPLEENNLYNDKTEIVKGLLETLEAWKKEFPETKIKESAMTGESAKLLKSLGYIQ